MHERKTESQSDELPGWVRPLVVISLIVPTPLVVFWPSFAAAGFYAIVVLVLLRALFKVETDNAIEQVAKMVRKE
ncbi:MAG TPA: hypothetical protein DDW52_13450 [Planctomycetaceae bacterium]|nr:hypothetical protein [Planctomycetaceae bacterium]